MCKRAGLTDILSTLTTGRAGNHWAGWGDNDNRMLPEDVVKVSPSFVARQYNNLVTAVFN